MEFLNSKKINGRGGYFQVAIAIHEKYPRAIAIGLIPKATKNGKYVPDYDKSKKLLCSFNQASRLANRITIFAYAALFNNIKTVEKYSEMSIGKSEIVLYFVAEKNEIELEITNNDESVSVLFDIDTAMIASDLVKSRLFEIESDLEIDQSNQSNIKINTPILVRTEHEKFRLEKEKLLATGYFETNKIDEYISLEKKRYPSKSKLQIVMELQEQFR